MKAVAAGLVLVGLAWLTAQRVAVWTDPGAFWTAEIAATGQPAAWINRAIAEINEAQPAEALADLRAAEQAATDTPEAAPVHMAADGNRAVILWREHAYDRAIALVADAPHDSVRGQLCRQWGGGARCRAE